VYAAGAKEGIVMDGGLYLGIFGAVEAVVVV
jgi:hypothetical protein